MDTKVCSDCKKELPLSEYYRYKSLERRYGWRKGKPYYYSRCKECHKKWTVNYRRSKPGWQKEQNRLNYIRWRKKILKDNCEVCGEDRIVEAAHIIPRNGRSRERRNAFYNKPENILTLCPNHHRLFDKGLLTEMEYKKIEERVKAVKKLYK